MRRKCALYSYSYSQAVATRYFYNVSLVVSSLPGRQQMLCNHCTCSLFLVAFATLVPAVRNIVSFISFSVAADDTNPCSVCLTIPPRFPVCFPSLPPSTTKRSSWKNCDTTVCLCARKSCQPVILPETIPCISYMAEVCTPVQSQTLQQSDNQQYTPSTPAAP
jgi:hypothetical protein